MNKRQPTAAIGKKLGRYRIEKELGRGGMGVVYVASDENLGRMVALKTTSVAGLGSGQDARNQRRARFIREVKALAQVNHENVVHVFDAGEADDGDLGWVLFYTMEHVEGITLAQLVHQQGALAPAAAAAVCMQVAAGLGAAHAQGIIHRDVKPANIFLTHDGRALIGDFGICKIEGSTQITRRDQLVGTPNYLAPEQILGEPITAATDVFALGALFFVIATNSPMRERTDAGALLRESQTNDCAKKVLADNRFPDALRKIIARSLDRDPAKRFSDGASFADALADHATRIPPLDKSLVEAAKRAPSNVALDTGTNPFASRPDDDDDDDAFAQTESSDPAANFSGTGAGGIEEVAKALLSEFSGGEKTAADVKPVLPTAQTESTVMFNLRQMEEAEDEKQKKKTRGALPLALSEPSGPMARPSVIVDNRQATTGAIDEDTADPLPGDDDVPAHLQERTETVPRTSTTIGGSARSPGITVKNLSHTLDAQSQGQPTWVFLAAAGIGGFVAALVVLFIIGAFVGDDAGVVDETPVAVAGSSLDDVTGEMPAACRQPPRSDKDRAQAETLYKRALEAFQTFKRQDALKFVDKALALNPRHAEAHFVRAQVLAEERGRLDEARAAYECVLTLAPGSASAESARRALKR